MRRFTKILLLQIFGILFVSAVLGELYLRFLPAGGQFLPEMLRQRSFAYEPVLFARHAFPRQVQEKDANLWWNVKQRINSLGYRGKDFSFAKPPGVRRVVIYGGSAVFDLTQEEGHDWPRRVEDLLHAKGINNVEVINAGIPKHATIDSLGRLLTEGHLLKPDYVILYQAWNDIKLFPLKKPLLRELKPYDPAKNPFLHYQGPVDRFWCRHSRLYSFLRYQYYQAKLKVGPEGIIPSGKIEGDTIVPKALAQYRLNVETFVDVARHSGAEVILTTQARLNARGNTPEEERKLLASYKYLPKELILTGFEKIDAITRDIAAKQQVPLLDLSAAMTGKSEYFTDHVHLNATGSAYLAQQVADYLYPKLKTATP